jgi:hypothetical protein
LQIVLVFFILFAQVISVIIPERRKTVDVALEFYNISTIVSILLVQGGLPANRRIQGIGLNKD